MRKDNPDVTFNLITADVSLISEVDKGVSAIKEAETKFDLLFLSAGFMPFEGRRDTSEGLDSSMVTRYYSRLRGGLVPTPEGLQVAKKTGGVVFIIDAKGEATDNEKGLVGMRERVVDKAVWSFTKKVFASHAAKPKDKL